MRHEDQAPNQHPHHNKFIHPGLIITHTALSLMLGIWTALTFPDIPLNASYPVALTVALLAILYRNRRQGHILILIFVYAVGMALGLQKLQPPAKPHIRALINQQINITCSGIILEPPARSLDRLRIILQVDTLYTRARLSQGSTQIRKDLFRTKTRGKVQLSMMNHALAHHTFMPGDTITVNASLSPPRGFVNPGGFNLPFFLQSQGIHISGWLARPADMIWQRAPVKWWQVTIWAERIRGELISFYNKSLDPASASLYRALITGDRSGLSQTTRELFANLGIYHLLAISGLHMGLLAGFSMWLSIKTLSLFPCLLLHIPAKQGAAILAMLPVFFYCFISGLQPPAVRAFLMTIVLFSAFILRKQWHGPTAIGLAAIIILSHNPLLLGMASFQLSFTAVTAIVLSLPLITNQFLTKPKRHSPISSLKATIVSGFMVSLVASIATLPLVLFHFNRISLISPLTTLLMEPLLCLWALGFGLAGSCALLISPQLADILLQTGARGFDLSLWFCTYINKIPHITLWLPTPTIWQIALFYLALSLFFILKNRLSAAIMFTTFVILVFPLPRENRFDQVTMLDVGKGNSTLIECRTGETILIDCGGPFGANFNIGKQVIAPLLWWKQIRSLDLLILSHADLDHYSGAVFLINHFRPKELWLPSTNSNSSQWQAVIQSAEKNNVTIMVPTTDQSFPLDNNGRLTSLSTAHLTRRNWSKNEQSLVIRFESAGYSFLLPGDIGKQNERLLTRKNESLRSTVIIAPHHGSKSSSTMVFLDKVQPEFVVFSASQYDKSLFPAPLIVKRYKDINSTPLSTAKLGAITFNLRPTQLDITTTRKGHFSSTTTHSSRRVKIRTELSEGRYSERRRFNPKQKQKKVTTHRGSDLSHNTQKTGPENYTSVKSVGGFFRNWTNLFFSIQCIYASSGEIQPRCR